MCKPNYTVRLERGDRLPPLTWMYDKIQLAERQSKALADLHGAKVVLTGFGRTYTVDAAAYYDNPKRD